MKTEMNKHICLAFAMLALLFPLHGCSDRETANDVFIPPVDGKVPSETEEENEGFSSLDLTEGADSISDDEQASNPSYSAGEDSRKPIDPDELAYLQTCYFSKEERVTANLLLASEYDRPEDVNLYWLFYSGVTGKDQTMSEEERQKARAALDSGLDVFKVTAEDAESFLLQYLGIGLADTNGVGVEYYAYLSEYDAYYIDHGDIPPVHTVTITDGYWDKNGDVVLKYYLMTDPWSDADTWTGYVRLEKTEAGYYVLENHFINSPFVE